VSAAFARLPHTARLHHRRAWAFGRSRRDIPDVEVRFLDTGHFALETHSAVIGTAMRDFLGRVVAR
jgi:hypothetical protein